MVTYVSLQDTYKETLDFKEFGFFSLGDLCTRLPEIFDVRVVNVAGSKTHMLHPSVNLKNKSSMGSEHSFGSWQKATPQVNQDEINKIRENILLLLRQKRQVHRIDLENIYLVRKITMSQQYNYFTFFLFCNYFFSL